MACGWPLGRTRIGIVDPLPVLRERYRKELSELQSRYSDDQRPLTGLRKKLARERLRRRIFRLRRINW